jgi:hypothetical protein
MGPRDVQEDHAADGAHGRREHRHPGHAVQSALLYHPAWPVLPSCSVPYDFNRQRDLTKRRLAKRELAKRGFTKRPLTAD